MNKRDDLMRLHILAVVELAMPPAGRKVDTERLIKARKMFEKLMITEVLHYCQGNQVRTASVLPMNRNTLRKKILEHDIDYQNICKEKAAVDFSRRTRMEYLRKMNEEARKDLGLC